MLVLALEGLPRAYRQIPAELHHLLLLARTFVKWSIEHLPATELRLQLELAESRPWPTQSLFLFAQDVYASPPATSSAATAAAPTSSAAPPVRIIIPNATADPQPLRRHATRSSTPLSPGPIKMIPVSPSPSHVQGAVPTSTDGASVAVNIASPTTAPVEPSWATAAAATATAVAATPPGRLAPRLVQALMDVSIELDLHADTYHFHLEVVSTLLILCGTQMYGQLGPDSAQSNLFLTYAVEGSTRRHEFLQSLLFNFIERLPENQIRYA
jgi:hypothetical protein